jgi:hypothetical protein
MGVGEEFSDPPADLGVDRQTLAFGVAKAPASTNSRRSWPSLKRHC